MFKVAIPRKVMNWHNCHGHKAVLFEWAYGREEEDKKQPGKIGKFKIKEKNGLLPLIILLSACAK